MEPVQVAGIVRESIVDGPGLRFVLFVQGCPHRCPGCHNPQTHDPAGGSPVPPERILEEFDKNPLVRGMTLSGGEPVDQAERLVPLCDEVLRRGKDLVLFTGYTFEELLKLGQGRPAVLSLLSKCRLLIDGRFVEAQKDLSLTFAGSRNQRLLDPAASLRAGRAVAFDFQENIWDTKRMAD